MLCCFEYTSQWARFELTTLVVIGTDWTGRLCKSDYHMIMTTAALYFTIIDSYHTMYFCNLSILHELVVLNKIWPTFLELKIWIYWSESNSWIYFYIILNKNCQIYWSEHSFTGLGLEDRCLSYLGTRHKIISMY
jgi:hypothetical protein